MPQKPSTQVLTLDDARSQVYKFRRDCGNVLGKIGDSISHGGLWSPDGGIIGYGWELDHVWKVFHLLFDYSALPGDIPKPEPGPHRIWLSYLAGTPYERLEWNSWEGLQNNLESVCLGQNKKRQRGTWFDNNRDERNRMLIRTPHR